MPSNQASTAAAESTVVSTADVDPVSVVALLLEPSGYFAFGACFLGVLTRVP